MSGGKYDTIQKARGVFNPVELIWIGHQFVYRDSVRYLITDELRRLVDSRAVDVPLPDIYTDTEVLMPINVE